MLDMGMSNEIPLPLRSGEADLPAIVPTDLANLALWLDADDSDTDSFTDAGGGLISNWDDKSSDNNQLAQGTGTAQPAISTANGNRSALFDGTDDRLHDGSVSISIAEFTYAIVFTPTNLDDNNTVAFRLRDAALFTQFIDFSVSNNDIVAFIDDGDGSDVNLSVVDVLVVGETRWAIVRVRAAAAGASDLLTSDGDARSADVTTPNATATGCMVGANANGATAYAGHIHDVICYERFITNNERTQLANYLNSKWTIS